MMLRSATRIHAKPYDQQKIGRTDGIQGCFACSLMKPWRSKVPLRPNKIVMPAPSRRNEQEDPRRLQFVLFWRSGNQQLGSGKEEVGGRRVEALRQLASRLV